MKKGFGRCLILVGSAAKLPHPSNFFDGVFHLRFEYVFIKELFKEIIRVAKPGARVLIGDESMLIGQEILNLKNINELNHYRYKLRIEIFAYRSKKCTTNWLLGGVFYVITFAVGSGEPSADFDFEIPGLRGGTHRTRFEGMLEGVPKELKARFYSYAKGKESGAKY